MEQKGGGGGHKSLVLLREKKKKKKKRQLGGCSTDAFYKALPSVMTWCCPPDWQPAPYNRIVAKPQATHLRRSA